MVTNTNPMKSYLRIITMLVLLGAIVAGCSKSRVKIKSGTGVLVDARGLDGCGFIIELDKPDSHGNQAIEILNSMEHFPVHHGEKVRFTYIEIPAPSICMAGTPAKIITIHQRL